MTTYQIVATTAMGLEAVVAKEVRALGYECEVENGKVLFSGDELVIARANMWLRSADRIKIIVGEFRATTFDQLFEKTKALKWAHYLPEDAEFPVQGKSVKSTLFSVPDCQAIVKKAIVSHLQTAYSTSSWLDETGPLYKIEVAILKDTVTLTLDTSGTALHKRGYRVEQGDAPLKETLAAALVQLTNWHPDRPFVDPFCGSGTIAIEAALIGQNIAPGFNRDFACEAWSIMPKDIWKKVRLEAEEKANYDQVLDISGFDIDHRMIDIAKENAIEAGLGDLINFKQMQVKDFYSEKVNGLLVGNPPYGERIGEIEEIEHMYREMGEQFKKLESWSVYILTSDPNFEDLYGQTATKKRKLFNGFIRTDFYQFWGKRVR
jgi:putative N6-adenine-specific DNA methylase